MEIRITTFSSNYILFICNWFKMIWIYTVCHSALVINHKPFFYFSIFFNKGKSMGLNIFPIKIKSPITFWAKLTPIYPARISFFDLSPKSNRGISSGNHPFFRSPLGLVFSLTGKASNSTFLSFVRVFFGEIVSFFAFHQRMLSLKNGKWKPLYD